jgi:hypothetical protein
MCRIVPAACTVNPTRHKPCVGAAAQAAPFLCEGVEPMGRGRAKAKQQKVARELKYSTPSTDLTALQRELSGTPVERVDDELDDDEDADPYGDYDDDDEEDHVRRR